MSEYSFAIWLGVTTLVAALAILVAGWALYAHFDRTAAERAALKHNYRVTCLADLRLRNTLRAVLVIRIHDPGTSSTVKVAFRKFVHDLDALPDTCLPKEAP